MNDKKVKVEFIESYIKIGNGDYKWNDNHGELIRCKDCKHGVLRNEGEIDCTKDNGTFKATIHERNWFCADGERRTDDARQGED